MKTICEAGSINQAGQLLMPMDRLNQEFARHKGQRVVATFNIVEPGSTEAQQAYYYNYIVPTIKEAFQKMGERKSWAGVDMFLVKEYPGDKSEQQIGLGEDVLFARDLNKSQMSDFLEWLKQYAAENLDTYIEDPKTI